MSLSILIVEDDEDIGQLYQMTLEALGHEVYLKKNGQEGSIEYNRALVNNEKNIPTPYDVILIDYLMPIKDGVSLAKEILNLCPQQRIIFITGHGPKLLPELVSFEGQVEVLVKPIPLTALIAKIENRREKEIAKKLYYKLRKWDGLEGLSEPTSQLRTGESINVFPG